MAWVKAVSAALPMLKLNPTSGVDLDNAGEYLKNGAFGVGLVAPLFQPDLIGAPLPPRRRLTSPRLAAAENWDQIHANAVKVIANTTAAGPVRLAPPSFVHSRHRSSPSASRRILVADIQS